MEFEINAKGALIDNGGKMELNCEVMLDGNGDGMIGGVCCLIMDIASTFNKTVEEVITDIYTQIKGIEN